MAKKRKGGRRREAEDTDKAPKQKPVTFSPFADLKKMLAEKAREVTKQAPPPPPPRALAKTVSPAQPVDEEAILREAYAGVRRLGDAPNNHRVPIQPRPGNRAVVSEEAEVLAALSDLVAGVGAFDLTETEEYVEGARVGLDPRLLSRLRRGEFAVQDHIDLHGMIQPDAKAALLEFVLKSVGKGMRTVLVVHGRGLGSPGGRPVLKHATSQWLSHGEIGAHVHAFATARPQDGGAGAMYVLLRRDRRRAAFDVLQGAKRRD
jgi:DNA-nicking Smr family endonuclease